MRSVGLMFARGLFETKGSRSPIPAVLAVLAFAVYWPGVANGQSRIVLHDPLTGLNSKTIDLGSPGPDEVGFWMDVAIGVPAADLYLFRASVRADDAGSALFRVRRYQSYVPGFLPSSLNPPPWLLAPRSPDVGGAFPEGWAPSATSIPVVSLLIEGTASPGVYSFVLESPWGGTGPPTWETSLGASETFSQVGGFTLTVIPEPVTSLLMALAGFLLMRRSRPAFLASTGTRIKTSAGLSLLAVLALAFLSAGVANGQSMIVLHDPLTGLNSKTIDLGSPVSGEVFFPLTLSIGGATGIYEFQACVKINDAASGVFSIIGRQLDDPGFLPVPPVVTPPLPWVLAPTSPDIGGTFPFGRVTTLLRPVESLYIEGNVVPGVYTFMLRSIYDGDSSPSWVQDMGGPNILFSQVGGFTLTVVPEPATSMLMLLAGFLLIRNWRH